MKILWPIDDLLRGDNQPGAVMVLSAVLEKAGHCSRVVAADVDQVLSALKTDEPAILAFSCMTTNVHRCLRVNRAVKARRKVFTVFGGSHATSFAEMIEQDGVDAICVGEGEGAIVDLVNRLERGGSIEDIQNLWVKRDGEIIRNSLRPLIDPLDSLPVPDHAVFERAIPRSLWRTYVHTSRGCPYGCTYCFNELFRRIYKGKGRWLRRRSVDHVIEELERIKASGYYRFIRFTDNLFILNPAWVEEFARRYRPIGIPFSCMVRADLVNESVVRCLAGAGCYSMSLGLEAGSDRVRNGILKRNMGSEDILRACRIIRRHGLRLGTFNIIGIPGSTLEEDFETLDLNIRCRPTHANCSMLQPYKRTAIYEYAAAGDWLEDDPTTISIDNVHEVSYVKFRDQEEKRRIENLHLLFPVIVKLPFLRPLASWLVGLRLSRLFVYIYSRTNTLLDLFVSMPPLIGLRYLPKRMRIHARLRRRR